MFRDSPSTPAKAATAHSNNISFLLSRDQAYMFRDSPSTPAKAATAHINNITVFCFHGIKLTCLEILLPLQLKQLQHTVTTLQFSAFTGSSLYV